MSDRRAALTLKTLNRSPTTTSCSSDGGGSGSDARAERIAQYKEERRRQLASQFGSTTREEAAAPKRYISRNGNNTSTSAGSSGSGNNGANILESSGGISKIRTTRASRLRAAAVSPSESSPSSVRDFCKPYSTPSQRIPSHQKLALKESSSLSTSRRLTKETTPPSKITPTNGKVGVAEDMVRRKYSTTTTATSSDKERSPVPSLDKNMTITTKREKDKSSKRKSNLNRSLTAEEVVNDIIEDSAVRRRRRRVELMPELREPLPKLGEGTRLAPNVPQSIKSSLRVTADSGHNFLQSKKSPTGREKTFSALLDSLRSPRSSPEKKSTKEKSPDLPSQHGKSISIDGTKDKTAKSNNIRGKVVENGVGKHYLKKKSVTAAAGTEPEGCRDVASSPFKQLNGDIAKSPLYSHKTGAHSEQLTATSSSISQEERKSVNMTKKSNENSPEDNNTSGSKVIDKLEILENDPSPSPERRLSSLPASFQEYIQSSHSFGDSVTRKSPLETSRSCSGSPVKHPSSILKKKSFDESCSLSQLSTTRPVSILKRKTSQDDAGPSHPVTFSPSVVDHSANRGNRPGILKKRASLDESEVMRRRSCSPDLAGLGAADFRPILKNQRRSSMEELCRRTQSPDPLPQSILKRRMSREDEMEERNIESPEPHGILKRKSASSASNSSSSSSSPHVSISATVLMNVGFDGTEENSDQVKPILKKKSSSEETSAPDFTTQEHPKPILKKKQSIEVEDLDEKPKKPILKSSRKSSQEECATTGTTKDFEKGVLLRKKSVGSDSVSNSDSDVKPILKQSSTDPTEQSDSPRRRLSFTNNVSSESSVIVISPVQTECSFRRARRDRPASVCSLERYSSGTTDNELFSILNKRRSWETEDSPFEGNKQLNSVTSNTTEECQTGNSVSVVERIFTMENTIQPAQASTGAVPKNPRFLRASRGKERFRTQPITLQELEESKRCGSLGLFQSDSFQRLSSLTNGADKSLESETSLNISSDSLNLPSERTQPPNISAVSEAMSTSHPDHILSSHSSEAMDVKDERPEGTTGLRRSSSVSERASLFAQLEEQMKLAAEEAKSRNVARKVLRSRDRKEDKNRFSTQPITMEEIQDVVRQNERVNCASTDAVSGSSKDDEGKEDDDHDPSKLSLAERVKLFNQKISEERLPKATDLPLQRPVVRKRASSRFKTQPVTTEEVDCAQKMSPLAASLVKPPDPQLLASLSAKAVKDKIYEHASNLLTKSGSTSRIPSDDVKPKGILKSPKDSNLEHTSEKNTANTNDHSKTGKKELSKEVERLQTPELESFQHLKNVLKKEAVGEEDTDTSIPLYDSLNQMSSLKRLSFSGSSSEEEMSSKNIEKSPLKQYHSSHVNKDLVSILHDVEVTARLQREKNYESNFQKEAVMNQINLNQEKENFISNHVLSKRTDSIVKSEHKHNKYKATDKEKSVITRSGSEESPFVKKIVESPHGLKIVTSKRIQQVNENSSANDTTTPTTSDGETSSSGGREIRRIIGNETNSHRKRPPTGKYNKNRSVANQQELAKSKSVSSVPTSIVERHHQNSSSRNVAKKVISPFTENTQVDACLGHNSLQRSYTQPLNNLEDQEVMSGASIAERLAALQKQGEIDWRKRVPKLNPHDELNILNELNLRQSNDAKSSELGGNGRILADRLGKLDAASQGWKKRVEPTDAVKFSVAGKMKLENKNERASSPLHIVTSAEKKKRTPPVARFRSKGVNNQQVASTPSSPQESLSPKFKRSISAPGCEDESADQDKTVISCSKVSVPRADDETFSRFFNEVNIDKLKEERIEVREEDFDEVSHSSQLLVQKRSIKIQRRHVSSKNPLKALAARTDLQDEYTEIRTGVAEREMRRLNVEKLSKNSNFAIEALAGLASKEDFTAVALKKSTASNMRMLPYKDLMLLHVKGRRHVQTRLVEPSVRSINRGDNYVLVTPTEVYNWVGKYSNVIEQSRGAEIALHIQQKKDLGCTGATHVITISDDGLGGFNSQNSKKFWKLLGGDENSKVIEGGHPDEDELYETYITNTNMVYEIQGEELVPLQEYWGAIPKIEMLDPSKILIFDFGSEMYVWNGKEAPLDRRRVAARLAQELWQEPYDYSDCDLCPINVTDMLGDRHSTKEVVKSGSSRPSWGLLGKVTQHMETILFREKFLDWPDLSRVIRYKGCDNYSKQTDASIDIKPCDVDTMVNSNPNDPDLELEGCHLGRGDKYFDKEMNRFYDIKTLNVKMWHIQEFEHSELSGQSVGQFHAGDSYVIRWQYSITVSGRELNGQPSRHSVIGRDRCAYFCWQGAKASLNEQGAAALLTVELDHERGPQVRVVQGQESPAFLRLFKGSMVVHEGKREEESEFQKDWHLYMCRGELSEEAVLVEVPCSMRQLRSRASMVLVNRTTGAVKVWHGSKSLSHTKKIALAAAEHLKKKPLEMEMMPEASVVIEEEYEGSESRAFLEGIGGNNRYLYSPLYDSLKQYTHTPRLFHLSSLSGVFSAAEVLSPCRHKDTTVPYPFLQSDLYGASQPALFLLDNEEELWLWQGWWPAEGDESSGDSSNIRGSHTVIWQAERKAAMQTALTYWQYKCNAASPEVYLVWAGLEPLEFTNLFPTWCDRDDIAELNIKDGKKPGEVLTVAGELTRITCSTYSATELMQRPLPDGVDPTRLEMYLDTKEFQDLLGMEKEEFLELPTWKQSNIKKEVGLF